MHATQIKLPKLGRKHASMVLDKWSRQRETHEGAYVTQVRRQGGSGEKLVCDTARTSTECATCRTAPCRPYTSVSAGSCNTQSRQTTLSSTSVRVRTVVTTKQFILAVIYFSSAYCPDPLHSPKFYIYIAGDNIYQPLHNFTDNTYCQVSAENINSILLWTFIYDIPHLY